MTGSDWWRDAVIYQIYPRSWADSDGDGLGDLAGIETKLPYLVDLGVDALWLTPFYPSPQRDGGYDVAEYCDVDPRLGSLADFDSLVQTAHNLSLKVLIDIVPNHTSVDHRWFQTALAAADDSAERDWYIFRPSRGDRREPPNNWVSLFGGPAWTQLPHSDLWYLHLFDSSQADLNWTNPEVAAAMREVLIFWLDRGVDGFRVDVADGLIKAPGLPDMDLSLDRYRDPTALLPMWDQPGVHDIFRDWRSLLDRYGDRIAVAEAWVEPPEALARYVRADELHQSFNFNFLQTPWNAEALRDAIESGLTQAEQVGASQTWVWSNHDVMRHASRLGRPGATTEPTTTPALAGDDPPDVELGLRRARAATLLMLALPGSAYLYQGEELGLPEVLDLPDAVRQDPRWVRSNYRDLGRDGCRVPMPWSRTDPSYGFSPSGRSWLPQPSRFGDLAVSEQYGDSTSTLAMYRTALQLRRELQLGTGTCEVVPHLWPNGSVDVLALRMSADDRESVFVVTNFGPETLAVPDTWTQLIVSAEFDERSLPTDACGWFVAE